MSLFSVTAGIQRKIWSLLLMNIQTLISLAMQGLILSCMISLLHGLGAEDVLPSTENGFALKQILLFPRKRSVIIILVSAGFFTKIFGDREVLAYVTDTEKGNGTKRLFFSTIFSEDLKVFCTEEEHSSSDQTDHDPVNYIPLLLYAFRWKIEIGYYDQKTFWSFCDYMVRSRKGIEMLVNLINISYCAMKILPYQDKYFSKYRTKSVQEFRFELSQEIRKQIFFATFVKNIETHIKSETMIKALKQLICQQVCHL